jgi:hypothetical protein
MSTAKYTSKSSPNPGFLLACGAAIKSNQEGTIWLDLLTAGAPVAFGLVVEVEVLR